MSYLKMTTDEVSVAEQSTDVSEILFYVLMGLVGLVLLCVAATACYNNIYKTYELEKEQAANNAL
jgi:hypothetical protein